ncbi:hypothetical protein GE09DRAFT_267087 [Coniochaeta sp. 2T2.1]|nr:hypothetical protein GE09DRAFT_267087 [Coniochaeta sp. 2T2.1]
MLYRRRANLANKLRRSLDEKFPNGRGIFQTRATRCKPRATRGGLCLHLPLRRCGCRRHPQTTRRRVRPHLASSRKPQRRIPARKYVHVDLSYLGFHRSLPQGKGKGDGGSRSAYRVRRRIDGEHAHRIAHPYRYVSRTHQPVQGPRRGQCLHDRQIGGEE